MRARHQVIDAHAVLSVARKCICQEGIDSRRNRCCWPNLPCESSNVSTALALDPINFAFKSKDKRLTGVGGELDFVYVAHRIDCAPKARGKFVTRTGSLWTGSRANCGKSST